MRLDVEWHVTEPSDRKGILFVPCVHWKDLRCAPNMWKSPSYNIRRTGPQITFVQTANLDLAYIHNNKLIERHLGSPEILPNNFPTTDRGYGVTGPIVDRALIAVPHSFPMGNILCAVAKITIHHHLWFSDMFCCELTFVNGVWCPDSFGVAAVLSVTNTWKMLPYDGVLRWWIVLMLEIPWCFEDNEVILIEVASCYLSFNILACGRKVPTAARHPKKLLKSVG